MIQTLTCIGCPMGCSLTVTIENKTVISVEGNTCPRGERYAISECLHPSRTVTGTVRVTGSSEKVISVKTATEVPKSRVLDVARALCEVVAIAPISIGDVVASNIAGTGADVIATKNIV